MDRAVPIPTIDNIADYISTSSNRILPASIALYLSGLKSTLIEEFPYIETILASKIVTDTLKGCRRLHSRPSVQAIPFNKKDFLLLPFPPANFNKALYSAIIAVGFAGLHKLGELVSPDQTAFKDDRYFIRWNSLSFSTCLKFAQYTLPFSKTDQFGKGAKVAIYQNEYLPACPIRRLVAYLEYRDQYFPNNPYLFINSRGQAPTRSWFMRRFSSMFSKGKTGHSLRSGGATALALAGRSLKFIQESGLWASEAFKEYIRLHPVLCLPPDVTNPHAIAAGAGFDITFSNPGKIPPGFHTLTIPFVSVQQRLAYP